VTSTQIGDLNRDGLPDIAVFEGGVHADGKTFAWFEAPNWVRHEFNPAYSPGPFTGDSALADINGDGLLDVVLPQDTHAGGGPAYLFWYQNPGKGSTGAWPRHSIGSWSSETYHLGELDVADMDADGKLDVVIRHLGNLQVRICFQDGPDSWTIRSFPVRPREGLKLADLDRDGKTDIILNGFWWAAPTNPRTGSYTEYIIDPVFFSQSVSGLNNSIKAGVGDIDGDGINDVAISPCEGEAAYLAWYRCPANPRTQPWVRHIIENNFGNCHQAKLADFDRDGDLDFLVGKSFGETGVYLWLNNGAGASWTKQMLNANGGLYSAVVGDIGADGDLDFVGPATYANSSKPLLYENLESVGTNVMPLVNVSAPESGQTFSANELIGFTASASDAEDGNLSGGITWKSDVDGPLGIGASIIIGTLSLGTHVITASVTDSGGLGGTASINVTVGATTNTAPVVSINSPADEAVFPEGTPIQFTGMAGDAQDGDLSALIQWRSDVDGALGTGTTISFTLSTGTHSITAAATDTGGRQGSSTIQVTVTATSLPFSNNLVLHLEATAGVGTSGNTVTSWSDQSGQGNHLTAGGNPQLIPALTRVPDTKVAGFWWWGG
jgi:hypothetical protein